MILRSDAWFHFYLFLLLYEVYVQSASLVWGVFAKCFSCMRCMCKVLLLYEVYVQSASLVWGVCTKCFSSHHVCWCVQSLLPIHFFVFPAGILPLQICWSLAVFFGGELTWEQQQHADGDDNPNLPTTETDETDDTHDTDDTDHTNGTDDTGHTDDADDTHDTLLTPTMPTMLP